MSTIKIQPLRDKVWIEKETPDEKSAGGIIIPENCQDPPTIGKVLAVGPGGTNAKGGPIPVEVSVGDRVLFKKYDGMNAVVSTALDKSPNATVTDEDGAGITLDGSPVTGDSVYLIASKDILAIIG